MNFRVLAGLCPLLASALLVACADRPKSDSGESVPSVSAGKLTKSAVTLPAGARDEAARAALPAIERAKVAVTLLPESGEAHDQLARLYSYWAYLKTLHNQTSGDAVEQGLKVIALADKLPPERAEPRKAANRWI